MSRAKKSQGYLAELEAELAGREMFAASIEERDPGRARNIREGIAYRRAQAQANRQILEVLWDLTIDARNAGMPLDDLGEHMARAFLQGGQPQTMADRILDVLRDQLNGRGVPWILEQIRPINPGGHRIAVTGRWGPKTVERTLIELERMGRVVRREWTPRDYNAKTLWRLSEYPDPDSDTSRRRRSIVEDDEPV